jgi:3-isopropylmalate/(R)-2-methylmalate dehydratase small subunit
METFTTLTGVAAPLPIVNVDTDMLAPGESMKTVSKTGLESYLFADMRYTPEGYEDPDFVLNKAAYRSAKILIGGDNFGCGSSREHAVWALRDYGFRAVIAPSFGDIFRNNALNEGLLPVVLAEEVVELLWARLTRDPGTRLAVDLVERRVSLAGRPAPGSATPTPTPAWVASPATWPFGLEEHSRLRLLDGLDDIDLTLRHEGAISDFEAARAPWLPVVPGR